MAPSHCHRPATFPSQRPEAGRSRGFPGSAVAPGAPGMSWLPASGTQPGLRVPLRCRLQGASAQSGIPCVPPAAPVPRQRNRMGGSIHSISPSLCWAQKAPGERKSTSCVPDEALGPAAGRACGAEGAVLGQGCRAPPFPSSSLLGKGPAWLPQPFLQAGLVCSPQSMDGLAAAYSKSERAVSGRAFAVPQAANRPCPTTSGGCRRRLQFPALPSAFPALTRVTPRHQSRATVPGLPHLSGNRQCLGEGRSIAMHPCFGSKCTGKLVRKGYWGTQRCQHSPTNCCPATLLPLLSPISALWPSVPISSRGLGDFSACLGQCEVFVPLVASRLT